MDFKKDQPGTEISWAEAVVEIRGDLEDVLEVQVGQAGPAVSAVDREGSVDPEVAEAAEEGETVAPPIMILALRRASPVISPANGSCTMRSSLCRGKRCMTPRIQLHGFRCCATTLPDGHPRWM